MNRAADHLFVFLYDFLYHSTVLLSRMFICLQLLSRLITPEFQVIALEFLIKQILQPARTPSFLQNIIASPDRHAELEHKDHWHLHSWLEVTLTYKMAFLGISMHLYKTNILPACQECCSWCLCKVCSSLGQKKQYGGKIFCLSQRNAFLVNSCSF